MNQEVKDGNIVLEDIVADYSKEDMYSLNETRLFYHDLPMKTMIVSGKQACGIKQSKNCYEHGWTI